MAWHDSDSWLTAAFAPNTSTIAVSLLLAIILPILLHRYLYRKHGSATNLPNFVLVGPSGAGKTALLTALSHGHPLQTHTSTLPHSLPALLPDSVPPQSSHFRSPGDPAYERARALLLTDTPGHGKLRHHALSLLLPSASTATTTTKQNLAGIVFVVDAAALAEEKGRDEASEYLHDVLLALQQRYTSAKTSKGPKEIPVLVAANKLDLFTALPEHLVRITLEKGVTEVRRRRARALRDSGVGKGDGEFDEAEEEEREWLGEGGEGAFEFGQMEEVGTVVRVVGGNVVGEGGPGVKGWWEWVAELL